MGSFQNNSRRKIFKRLALIGLKIASEKLGDSINVVKCKHGDRNCVTLLKTSKFSLKKENNSYGY